MKVRKWHIYIIAVLCFIICFVTLNTKYDSFYRVNGINNDNRALIEQYLDEEQQQYLIDNSIAVNLFIQYIKVSGFRLQNYEYYNKLAKAKVFSSAEELIENANIIVSRLEVLFPNMALAQCEALITNNLVKAFVAQEGFEFKNIEYYQIVRMLYDTEDYQYIEDTNTYVLKLENEGLVLKEERLKVLKDMIKSYDKESLHLLLTTPLPEGTKLVYQPEALDVVVDQSHFIGNYQPKKITTIQASSGIGIDDFTMYMETEAYNAYVKMYEDILAHCGSNLVLVKAYCSYETLSRQTSTELEIPGFNEYQLGTTLAFRHKGYSRDEFVQSPSYQWLVENAHNYGYILRYPEGKEEVTGHAFKSNIFRYVGVDLATKLYTEKITLEEYHTQLENMANQEP